MIRAAVPRRTNRLEHDDDMISMDHDELWWLSPNTVEIKSQFVAIELCRQEDVIHNEIWCNAIQLLLNAGIWIGHGLICFFDILSTESF